MRLLVVCLFVLLPLEAAAQSWPSLYRVVNVAGGDSLNIRAEPTASAEIIGVFAPDQTGIEVTGISPDGKWAQVNGDESSGWASLRFLAKELEFGWPPPSLTCFGAEPFWSASIIHSRRGNSVVFQDMNAQAQEFEFPRLKRSANTPGRYSEIAWPQQGGDASDYLFTSIFSAQSCSDGMSDRIYGISVDMLVPAHRDWQHYSGCCSILP
jgi:uncharacterized membrane protein